MACLQLVHYYYSRHSSYRDSEGLSEFKGPQDFSDVKNKDLLYYYGKGWFEWYKKSVFEAQIEKVFGITDAPIIKLKLHGSDPWTDRVSPKLYEQLLKMTHDVISRKLERENWRDKLISFTGLQCHEWCATMEYKINTIGMCTKLLIISAGRATKSV